MIEEKEFKKIMLDFEEEFKKIMLDFSDVNPNCPESVRKYGKRCALAGEIYFGMKWGEKEVARLQKEIERLKEKTK
jgi:hypothetical protein